MSWILLVVIFWKPIYYSVKYIIDRYFGSDGKANLDALTKFWNDLWILLKP